MTNEILNENIWRAIVNNDADSDGKFYYGVSTTKIFCRPSCKSRLPLREHVHIYYSIQEALSHQFRPCKRCKPDGSKLPNEAWIQQISQWMDLHYAESLNLDKLAELFHGSPYHLHRTFKRINGVSPSAYIQRVRMNKAQEFLKETEQPVAEIGIAIGIPNAAHFATLFQKLTGTSPTKYRQLLLNGGDPNEPNN